MSSPSVSTARPHVTAVIVAHEGAQWIPHLMSSLEMSSRFPDQLVAVDNGSTDGSLALLREALGPAAVVEADPATGFGAAAQIGLDSVLSDIDPASSWVWLLHDDCAPSPDTLERLLATAALDDGIAVVGCRVRAWPRGRRLLEVGVGITGTGRRRTGLEPGEYDQGQHDVVRDVLSVSSAGMLVRRGVWDRLRGFDPRLPLYRDDADFGWRVARAGHRVVVAPDALLFHAEAASRGVRPVANTASHPHQADRQAALYTLLVNCSLLVLPLQLVRLVIGTLVRALGFLLGKLPSAALDEIRALGHVLARPLPLLSGRRFRRRTAAATRRQVRALLPPWWTPYRDGAESLLELGAAQVRTRASRTAPLSSRLRRSRRDATALESGPVPDDAINLPVGVSPWAWALRHPLVSIVAALTVCGLVAGRGLWGDGLLQGGALLAAPPDAVAWWRLYAESWHPVQLGSTSETSPYVAVLAMLGTLVLGNAWLVVDVLVLLAVPLSALGAFVVSRRLVDGLTARIWMTVSYSLLPVVSGAVASGHLGTVVSLILLPWLLRSGLRLVSSASWRHAFGGGLLLSVIVAFAPVAWLLVAALTIVAMGWLALQRRAGVAVRLLVWAALPAVLLLPWSLRLLTTPSLLLSEAGVVRDGPAADVGWPVLLGRLDAAGDAPMLLTVGIMLAAVAALLRRDRRRTVAAAWIVIAVCMVAAAVLADQTVPVAGTTGEAFAWLGVPVTWAQAAAIVAAGAGADRLTASIRSGSFSWRQPVAAVVAALAVAAPVTGVLWWVVDGPRGDLDRDPVDTLPAYMADAMRRDVQQRVLVVTGDDASAGYRLLVDDGLRLGEDSVLPVSADDDLTDLAGVLLSEGSQQDVSRLADLGVEYVVLPQPADPDFVAALDGTVGLSRASTTVRQLVGWQVDAAVGQMRVLDPGDLDPEVTAEVLDSPRGVADGEISEATGSRVLLVATTSDGFAATLDGEALDPAERDGLGQAFSVGPDGGRLHVEHESTRARWLLLQVVVLAVCILLAAPSLNRRDGLTEVRR